MERERKDLYPELQNASNPMRNGEEITWQTFRGVQTTR